MRKSICYRRARPKPLGCSWEFCIVSINLKTSFARTQILVGTLYISPPTRCVGYFFGRESAAKRIWGEMNGDGSIQNDDGAACKGIKENGVNSKSKSRRRCNYHSAVHTVSYCGCAPEMGFGDFPPNTFPQTKKKSGSSQYAYKKTENRNEVQVLLYECLSMPLQLTCMHMLACIDEKAYAQTSVFFRTSGLWSAVRFEYGRSPKHPIFSSYLMTIGFGEQSCRLTSAASLRQFVDVMLPLFPQLVVLKLRLQLNLTALAKMGSHFFSSRIQCSKIHCVQKAVNFPTIV